MILPTLSFVLFPLLATSAFAAPTSGENVGPAIYVADPDMDWNTDGTLYEADGKVALKTKLVGKNLEIYYGSVTVARIESVPNDFCAAKIEVSDAVGVKFTLHAEDTPNLLYRWTYQRPDQITFQWDPYSESTVGVDSVGGIVHESKDQSGKHSGEIGDLATPQGFPKGIIKSDNAYTIQVRGPAPVERTPRPLEMVELTYLLVQRSKCPHRND